MRNKGIIPAFLFLFFFMGVAQVNAGLINYERRERMLKRKEAQELIRVKGRITKVDRDNGRVHVLQPQKEEELALILKDKDLMVTLRPRQNVSVTYNRNTKLIKKIDLILDD